MNNQAVRQSSFTLVALFVLLAATIALAYVDLGHLHTPVAMVISVAKAVLIYLVFMNLRHEKGLVLLAAGAGFFWLLIMVSLTLGDYLTRHT